MRFLVTAAALAVALFSPLASAAEGSNEAIERGLRHMGAGEYGKALREFLAAKQLAPTPRTDAQIAIAEQALEHLTDAEIHLMEVLQAKDDPWVKKNRKGLEESLAGIRAKLGSLSVIGKPPGGDVRLNGELVGTVPMQHALRLHVGSVRVYVTAAGYVGNSQRVEIAAGQTTTLDVDLARMTAPPPPAPPPPPPSPVDVKGGEPAPLIQTPTPAPVPKPIVSDPYRGNRMGGWAYAVGGALSVAAGSYLWAHGDPSVQREAIGKGIVAAGAASLICGSAIVIGSQPISNGKGVSLGGSLVLAVGGRF